MEMMPVLTILHQLMISTLILKATLSTYQDVDDSHGDNDGESVSNEGHELLSDNDSDTLYMLNDDMLEDNEPSRIEDEDEVCVVVVPYELNELYRGPTFGTIREF